MSAKIYNTPLERQRAYREANKERIKVMQKAWWDANKGRYPKKRKERRRKFVVSPIVKAELSKEDIYYIQNHIHAGVDFEIIANRACCDVSDIERIMRRKDKNSNQTEVAI